MLCTEMGKCGKKENEAADDVCSDFSNNFFLHLF